MRLGFSGKQTVDVISLTSDPAPTLERVLMATSSLVSTGSWQNWDSCSPALPSYAHAVLNSPLPAPCVNNMCHLENACSGEACAVAAEEKTRNSCRPQGVHRLVGSKGHVPQNSK